MHTTIEILYIDDEINNLMGFKANFRFHYMIHTASSTKEAEELLVNHPNIRIIFCDNRMPEETGIDFLYRIKEKFPRPIRILLTAYVDMETVIDAINKGNIYRFVRKPWEREEIISAIEEANRFYIASSLLDIKNEELQKAYQELDKFAYSVSHDLRDPLTGVLSAIKVAVDFDKIDDMKGVLSLMLGTVTKLHDYIDNLRDYYLLRRGELHLTEIDFSKLLSDIEEFYKMYTANHDVDFNTNIDQPFTFKCDHSLLELILHNLLSNAFKYQRADASHKSVDLSVSISHGAATITISDTGIGIPPESIQNIFKIFYRATNQAQGMGFGLYNVYGAVKKLNGTIDVESTLGSGTTFKLVIPSK